MVFLMTSMMHACICQQSLHAANDLVSLSLSLSLLVTLPSLSILNYLCAFMMTEYATYLWPFGIPTCFCGRAAIAIHASLRPSTRVRSNTTSAEERLFQNECPKPHASNWIYECHFSPQQEGMTPLLPCPKYTPIRTNPKVCRAVFHFL